MHVELVEVCVPVDAREKRETDRAHAARMQREKEAPLPPGFIEHCDRRGRAREEPVQTPSAKRRAAARSITGRTERSSSSFDAADDGSELHRDPR